MPRTSRSLAIVVAAAMLLTAAPARGEDECAGELGNIYVYSAVGVEGQPTLGFSPKGYACDFGILPDGGQLIPGANTIYARYLEDLQATELNGYAKGLGIDEAFRWDRGMSTSTALLSVVLGGSYSHGTPTWHVDPAATGTFEVSIELPEDGGTVTAHFHR